MGSRLDWRTPIWETERGKSSLRRPCVADTSFDVLIIGSGPGGYVTAIRAAQLGFKTAIIERDYLGGICLNWGCVPTKALLRSAEIYHYMQHAKDYGLKADNVGYDAAEIVKRSRGVSKRLNDGVGFLMKKNKVQIIWGEASIDAPGKVTVKASKSEAPKGALPPGQYQAKHIIIATGARPRVLPVSSPTRNWSGLISRPWCRRRSRNRCWWSAPAPSASSSPRSTARSAPT